MRYKKILICIALILVSVLGVELFSNRDMIFLNKSEKGIIELQPTLEENENQDEVVKTTVKFDVGNKYVSKFEFDYKYNDLLNSNITIGYVNGFGNVEEKSITDSNSVLLNKNIINVNERVQYIKVEVPNVDSSNIQFKKGKILNRFEMKFSRMCITFSIVFILEMLLLFRNYFLSHLENAFVLVALLMGICMLLCVPNIKIGWDEETHFNRAYKLAILPSQEKVADEINGFFSTNTLYNYPLAQPSSGDENEEIGTILNDAYDNGKKKNEVKGWTSSIYTPGYVFQALGIKLAKLCGLSFTGVVFCGRLFSLLSYVVLLYFAIKILPIGKEILFFISAMPTSILIAITFNYDVVVYGCIVLGIALILREYLSKKEVVNEKFLLLATLIMTFGCLPKAVYAPLVLLPIMIPNKRFKSKEKAYCVKIVSGLAFALLMSTFVLPALLGKAQNDTRGGAVDSAAQLKSILTHPITYTGVLLEHILKTFPSFVFGEAQYRLMAHLQTARFEYLIPAMAAFVILVSPKAYDKTNYNELVVKDRIWFIVLIGLSVALVWTSLYMAYTVPGVEMINGVQGRYYKPVLPLFYIFLSSFHIHLNIKEDKYRLILVLLCLLVLAGTCLNLFNLYCL